MSGRNETTILQEDFVKITNLRTIIGTINYSMADIQSVNLTKQPRNKRPLWLAVVGILFLLWSLLDQTTQYSEFFNIGVFLIVIGLALVIFAKPSYSVQVGSATGTGNILSSTDPNFVQRIVEAMNRAIALR